MKRKIVYSDNLTLGIIFDTETVGKLMDLCGLYEIEPYELLAQAIETMHASLKESDE